MHFTSYLLAIRDCAEWCLVYYTASVAGAWFILTCQ